MGSATFQALYRGTPPIDLATRAGDAAPGGPRDVSFMLIVQDPSVDGGWKYEREIPGQSGWSAITHDYKQYPVVETITWDQLRCFRHVFRIEDKSIVPDPLYLVIAQHPYSAGWVHGLRWDRHNQAKPPTPTIKFKPGSQAGPYERPDATRQTFPSNAAMIGWFESLSHDYWDTASRRLTAGILDPQLSMPPNPNHQDDWSSKNLMVKAVCPDPGNAYDQLWHSQRRATLAALAEQGSLPIHVPEQGKRPLRECARFKEARDRIDEQMHLSIQQALAGPHQESERWFGRPVVELLDLIFAGNMYTCARARPDRAVRTGIEIEGRMATLGDGQRITSLDLEDALAELARQEPEVARVLRLRFIRGLTMTDIGAELGIDRRRVNPILAHGLAWLLERYE